MAGEHAIGLDRERASGPVEAQDADELLIHVQLPARHAQRAGDGEEEPLLGLGVAEDRVEDAREERAAAEAAGLDRSGTSRGHGSEHANRSPPAQRYRWPMPPQVHGTSGRHDGRSPALIGSTVMARIAR